MTEQQALQPDQSADSSQPTSDLWRKEIHARLAGYRSRRGRRIEGAFTMRFPFPPAETMEVESLPELADEPTMTERVVDEIAEAARPCAVAVAPPDVDEPVVKSAAIAYPAAVADPPAIAYEEPEALPEAPICEPEPDPEPRPAPLPRPRAKRKVIAFPRQVSEAPAPVHRLADPIVPDQPRILDVPEELEAYPNTPLLDGLQFSANGQQADAPHADHIELPFRAVGISQRLYAGLVDCAIVAAAGGIFGAVGYKMLPKLVVTKPIILTAAAVPVLLWAIYQYILTVYGGKTAGMRVAGVCLKSFKGTRPNMRQRRSRAIGLYFSTASLLMGLLWALVDVDMLCWHDRISRTYLTNQE
jgi:uncharacterized RDD family membrane protein YckC